MGIYYMLDIVIGDVRKILISSFKNPVECTLPFWEMTSKVESLSNWTKVTLGKWQRRESKSNRMY